MRQGPVEPSLVRKRDIGLLDASSNSLVIATTSLNLVFYLEFFGMRLRLDGEHSSYGVHSAGASGCSDAGCSPGVHRPEPESTLPGACC